LVFSPKKKMKRKGGGGRFGETETILIKKKKDLAGGVLWPFEMKERGEIRPTCREGWGGDPFYYFPMDCGEKRRRGRGGGKGRRKEEKKYRCPRASMSLREKKVLDG